MPTLESLANADATIRGTNPGDPVSVSQTTQGTSAGLIVLLNTVEQSFEAEAVTTSGPVDVTNSLITVGTIALSSATSSASIDAEVTQTNGNVGTSNAPLTAQEVDETNSNDGDFDFDASATAGYVNVSSTGDVSEPVGDGINAASEAAAVTNISSDVTQSNANSLTGTTSGNNQPLTQSQDVDQTNLNLEELAAESEASSGDVTVSRDGSTIAALDGINGAI